MDKLPEMSADNYTGEFPILAKVEKEEEAGKSYVRYVDGLFDKEYIHQLEETKRLKNMLTTEEGYETLDGAIQPHVVEQLHRFLAKDFEGLTIQSEAACTLRNLAFWTTEILKDYVPFYVTLCRSEKDFISEQAFWVLGKIACSSLQRRDLVLRCRAMDTLLEQFVTYVTPYKLRSITWTMSVLCRGHPKPPRNQVYLAALKLSHAINRSRDDKVLSWSCLSMYHLSKGTNDEVRVLIDVGLCSSLAMILNNNHSFEVIESALSALESIVSRDTTRTKEYHEGLIQPLCNLLRKIADSVVLLKTLDTLCTILSAADMEKGLYVNKIADEGGWDIIEKLRDHENSVISHRAKEIIEMLSGKKGNESVEQGDDGIEPGAPFLTRAVPFLTRVSPLLIVVLLNLVPFLTQARAHY